MKILFIGNSYTFFNDMPKLLEALAKENGKELAADSVTKGGRHLYENLADGDEYRAKIESLIKENSYDVLFLQEQSFLSITDFNKFLYGVKSLKEAVGAKRTILYSTWGRKKGSKKLEELGLSSEEMSKKLIEAYICAARYTNSEISPVGKAFLSISKANAEIELYNPDLSHPSYVGSAVAAICHYYAIFSKLPARVSILNDYAVWKEDILRAISEAYDEN